MRGIIACNCRARDFRIHLMSLSCAGLKKGDIVHAGAELPEIEAMVRGLGYQFSAHPALGTIIMLHRPRENDLLGQINRLRQGNRIIVYNLESDIETMTERSFELATACIFDSASAKVLRVFDSIPPKGACRRIDSYIDVELDEESDAGLSIHASRIAALR